MTPRYIQAKSLEEAKEALARYGSQAKVIAGGTALVLMMQQKLVEPAVLVAVDRIPELVFERLDPTGLQIGAAVKLRDVAGSPPVRERFPALAGACRQVGNVRVRNQATLGGNLAEADYASDPPAVLLALDARIAIEGPHGGRSLPLSEFFLGFYTTALQEGELLVGISVPELPPGTRTAYLKYKSRSSEDRPCVGVAAVAVLDGGVCRDLRVAVGAACEVPQRFPSLEALALGERLGDELIETIAEAYSREIEPLEDLRGSAWYRRQVTRVYVRRALQEVRDGDR